MLLIHSFWWLMQINTHMAERTHLRKSWEFGNRCFSLNIYHFCFLVATTTRFVGQSVHPYARPSVTTFDLSLFMTSGHYCNCPIARDSSALYPCIRVSVFTICRTIIKSKHTFLPPWVFGWLTWLKKGGKNILEFRLLSVWSHRSVCERATFLLPRLCLCLWIWIS